MNLLLDTHILLWTIFEPKKLPTTISENIRNPDNIVSISIASLWEIAIKQNIGRLSLPYEFFYTVQNDSGFTLLSIQPTHIQHYLALPLYHRDPFDRMLIAQAKVEQLTLATVDEHIARYNLPILK